MVVAEKCAGAVDDLDGAAVVDGQRVRHGAREQPVVVDEERRVGAGVAVDALVVVADAEHVEGREGEQPHEQHVGRREVLELVDEEVPARPLDRTAERPVGEQRLHGGVDLLVEVDDAARAEVGAERREQLGEAGHVVARRLDGVGIGEAEADRREALDVRADRVGVGAPLAPAREQRVDEAAHLGLLDDRRRPAAVLGEDPQAERVQRPDAGPEVGGARLHLQLRLLVVGDGEDGRRLVRPVAMEVAQPFGEDTGLARAGRGDDPGRPADVGDRGELVGREIGTRLGGRRDGGERSEVDRVAVHDDEPVRRRHPRPAVDPRRRAVGERDVGRPVRRGGRPVVEARRLDRPPPHRIAGPGVVRVGPRQEVEAVEPRLGLGRRPPRLDRERLRLAELAPGRARGRRRRAGAPATARAAAATVAARVGEHGVVDRDDGRVAPRHRERRSPTRPRPPARARRDRERACRPT